MLEWKPRLMLVLIVLTAAVLAVAFAEDSILPILNQHWSDIDNQHW
jgi:hypothetical protein